MHLKLMIGALGALLLAAAPGGATGEADKLVGTLAAKDPGAAARAEAQLAAMGSASTAALGRYLALEHREERAVEAILRVVARVGDPQAAAMLLPEWERSPSLRAPLIDAWAALGNAAVSPLTGYFAVATPDQQERIVGAIAPLGDTAVQPLKAMQEVLRTDGSGVAQRLSARIDEVIAEAPVATLIRRGPAGVPGLERMAADPASSPAAAAAALKGLGQIASRTGGENAALALRRLAARPLPPPQRASAESLADDAWLTLLARRGEAAAPDYEAILLDPNARDALRMGAANGLFGLGSPGLPHMEKAAAGMKPGPAQDYLAELTAALRAMTPAVSAATAPVPAKPAPADPPPGPVCSGDTQLRTIARVESGGRPISPRWFRRSGDRQRLVYTTVDSGYYRLVTSATDGTASVTVAPLAHQLAPDSSWDSRRLTFLGTDELPGQPILRNDVYTSTWDGKELRKLSTAIGIHTSPVWLTNREDVVFARNDFGARDPNGRPMAEAVILRSADSAGAARELLRVADRIVTALESSPDVLHLAFLAWKVESPPGEASLVSDPAVYFISIDGAGLRTVSLSLSLAAAGTGRLGDSGRWGRPLTAGEALALGGDLTWSADGRRITALGRLIDAQSAQIEARVDPSNDSYAARLAGRSLLTDGDTCIWFNDTRQVCKRCLNSEAVQILADCRGALLWHDDPRNALALFDSLSGEIGLVALPRKKITPPGANSPGNTTPRNPTPGGAP